MLDPVALFCSLGIVPLIYGAHKIPRDTPDALKWDRSQVILQLGLLAVQGVRLH